MKSEWSTKEIADILKISDKTVLKYIKMLEKAGYNIERDQNNSRIYTEQDAAVLKEFMDYSKEPGNTLTAATKYIVSKYVVTFEKSEEEPIKKESDQTILSDREILSEIHKKVISLEKNVENLTDENKEMADTMKSYMDILSNRDIVLVNVMRSQLEQRKLEMTAQEQSAATTEKQSILKRIVSIFKHE